MPSVITSRAIVRAALKSLLARPLQTMSRSVTIPISRSFSPIGMQPISCPCINFAISVTGVSGLTQSTPLCITYLTLMEDLRCNTAPPVVQLYNGSAATARAHCREQVHDAFVPSLLICETWKKHEPTVQGLLAMKLPRLSPFVCTSQPSSCQSELHPLRRPSIGTESTRPEYERLPENPWRAEASPRSLGWPQLAAQCIP